MFSDKKMKRQRCKNAKKNLNMRREIMNIGEIKDDNVYDFKENV